MLAIGAGNALGWALPSEAAPFSGAAGIAAGDYGVWQRSTGDLALPDRSVGDELFFRCPAGRTLGAISAIDMDRHSSGAARSSKISHLVKAGCSQRRRVAC